MNDLQIFNNEAFGKIRVINQNGAPWFVVSDICDFFNVSNRNRVMQKIDDVDKGGTQMNTPGGVQTVAIVNESGLYSLIFALQPTKSRGMDKKIIEERQSRLREFKHWVTSEVLPSIRKTGGYVDNDEAFINTYLPFADEQTKTLFKSTLETVKSLNSKIEKDKPKVLFADAVETAQNSILIGDLAKLIKQNGYDIGQKRLFEYLRNNGFLIKSGVSKNMPTQRSMDMKLFEVKERTINNPDGSVRVTKTTKVTGKGQVYFISKFVGTKKIDDGIS